MVKKDGTNLSFCCDSLLYEVINGSINIEIMGDESLVFYPFQIDDDRPIMIYCPYCGEPLKYSKRGYKPRVVPMNNIDAIKTDLTINEQELSKEE